MTQIEVTDADIAEALLQMGRPERIIDEALKIGAFTQAELNFARAIANLRVVREALRHNRQGWENALELGLIPERHTQTAHDLVNVTGVALASIGATEEEV